MVNCIKCFQVGSSSRSIPVYYAAVSLMIEQENDTEEEEHPNKKELC